MDTFTKSTFVDSPPHNVIPTEVEGSRANCVRLKVHSVNFILEFYDWIYGKQVLMAEFVLSVAKALYEMKVILWLSSRPKWRDLGRTAFASKFTP
jgi:hypothetical protein